MIGVPLALGAVQEISTFLREREVVGDIGTSGSFGIFPPLPVAEKSELPLAFLALTLAIISTPS